MRCKTCHQSVKEAMKVRCYQKYQTCAECTINEHPGFFAKNILIKLHRRFN
jgi:hypothetical protein